VVNGPGGQGRSGRCAGRITPLLLGTFLGGCALLRNEHKATPAELAARAQVDQRIQREVEARFAAEPSLTGAVVRVEAKDGEVALYGSVKGSGALRCAERNTELVHGVTLVIDQLVLEPGPVEVRCRSPRAPHGR
jgi:hypothetical protein